VQELKMRKIHASETAWVGTDFDHIIENDADISDLYTKIASIISDEVSLAPSNALLA
jgi:hypothetical protein